MTGSRARRGDDQHPRRRGTWDTRASKGVQTPSCSSPAPISLVQSLSRVQLCDPMDCGTPGLPVHHQLPKLAQTHGDPVGDAIQPSHPLSPLLLLPSVFLSIRISSSESALHIRWPKYWSFSFNNSPSSDYFPMTYGISRRNLSCPIYGRHLHAE